MLINDPALARQVYAGALALWQGGADALANAFDTIRPMLPGR